MSQPLLLTQEKQNTFHALQSQNLKVSPQLNNNDKKLQKNTQNLNQTQNITKTSQCQSIIQQYNLVIELYNHPLNIIQTRQLQKMPISSLYNDVFSSIKKSWKSKILALALLFIPLIDIFFSLFILYLTKYYFDCLNIHNRNKQKVHDPFQKMTFDPELCFTLKRDYYFFTIQFKQLDGFSLNYNKKIREEISLRKQRGKVQFMVYNAKFWAYYNHFQKWKKIHLILAIFALIITIGVNVCIYLLIF